MDKELFDSLMQSIVEALIARGYNPYAQIKGYLLEKEPAYITSFDNARKSIVELDSAMIQDYIIHWDEKQDQKWRINFINEKF